MKLQHSFRLCLILALYLGDVFTYPTQFPDDNSDAQIEDRRRKHRRKKRPCARQDANTGRWFWGHDLTLFLGDVTIVTGNSPCHGTDAEILPNKPLLGDHIHRPGILGGQKPGLLDNHRPGILGGQKPGLLDNHRPGILGGQKPGLLDNHRPGILGGQKPGLLDNHRPGILGGQKPGLLDNHRPLFPLFGNKPNHHRPSKPTNGNKPVHEVIEEDEEQDQYRPGSLVGAPSAQIDGHGQDLTNFSPSRIFSQISRHFNRIVVDPFIDLFV